MWPTPSASDNRDRGNRSTPAIKRRIKKGKQVMLSMCVSDESGALNPPWVEWLMGFPIEWTDLKD
jgi:DNA (cytosine-5)-methyltransferase 1